MKNLFLGIICLYTHKGYDNYSLDKLVGKDIPIKLWIINNIENMNINRLDKKLKHRSQN